MVSCILVLLLCTKTLHAVALEQPYNESVDVYSFAVLLFQICSLETPFEGFTMKMFERKVTNGGLRPKLNNKWSPRMQKLLSTSWHVDISKRPNMDDVVEVLREELAENTDEMQQDFLDASNKSQKSLHSMHNMDRIAAKKK